MFAKILRIVAKWYGNPTSEDVFPQIFEDAAYAWKTGQFEGESVFQAEDPGQPLANRKEQTIDNFEADAVNAVPLTDAKPSDGNPIGTAGIRIDLSRIGGPK